MANGICIFAENYNGKLEPASAELVSAARLIQETTKEQISAVVAAKDCDGIIEELKSIGVEKIYVVKTDRDILLQDDAASQVLADMIKKIDPSSVLIPATPAGRSIFSRVAMKLNCGLTADCTELLVGTKEDEVPSTAFLPCGTFFIQRARHKNVRYPPMPVVFAAF